ncbi:uncharacterized protein LOC135831888 [Planococcus citri]|uniref:uncharacterized protein LOC135831888 n=1 Tax=Planococcus citri TaxID=170843 RepID=UPI0031F9F084
MDSPSTESRKSVYSHLSNIANKGNICSLKNASLVKKPLVTGRVMQKLPIVRKSKYQTQDVLVVHLKEVCSLNSNELLQFRVIFINDAAQLAENLYFEEGDCLAFCDVKLFPVTLFRPNAAFFCMKQIIVGLGHSNNINNVYYKRKNMPRWSQILSTNPEIMESRVIDFENTSDESVTSEPSGGGSPVRNEISVTKDCQIIIPRLVNNDIIPSTSGDSDVLVDRVESIEETNDAKSNKASKSRNVMSDLIRVFEEHNAPRTDGNKEIPKDRNEKFVDPDIYQYVKLNRLEKNSRVNVYGIVRRIVKKPTLLSHNKCHLVVNIIDDSKTDEFLVNIFAHSLDALPKVLPYCIIRLHRLQIEEYNGGVNGRVSHGRDVLVFDKDDTSITYSTANKFTLTDSDKKKVEELKEWALEHLTNFRPFTTLNSLELKRKTINLTGKVSYVKGFEDRPTHVVVVRIRDGTKCTLPHERLSLCYDAWDKVITHSEPSFSASEDIDVVVAEPDGNFRTLKIGDQIELYNVEVTLRNRFMKTNVTEYLTFHVKGTWENLKLVPSKENYAKESSSKITNTKHHHSIPSTSKSDCALEIVKRRRLFDPDNSVVLEDEDFNKNENELTSTDKLENACETSKRREDANLLNNKPMCSKTLDKVTQVSNSSILEQRNVNITLAKETQVSNAPIFEQHDAIENVISRIENGPVLPNGSKETGNYVLKWPQPISEVPFNIKVNLISTNPAIDENCAEQDVLSLIKSYCTSCEEFFPYHLAKWIEVEGDPAAFCDKCKVQGYLRELKFVLTLTAYLLDQHGEVSSAVIIGDYAENFLGFTVADICSSKETRIKVRDVLNSYFCRAGRKKKSLIASVHPIANNSNEFKYHITELKCCVSSPI